MTVVDTTSTSQEDHQKMDVVEDAKQNDEEEGPGQIDDLIAAIRSDDESGDEIPPVSSSVAQQPGPALSKKLSEVEHQSEKGVVLVAKQHPSRLPKLGTQPKTSPRAKGHVVTQYEKTKSPRTMPPSTMTLEKKFQSLVDMHQQHTIRSPKRRDTSSPLKNKFSPQRPSLIPSPKSPNHCSKTDSLIETPTETSRSCTIHELDLPTLAQKEPSSSSSPASSSTSVVVVDEATPAIDPISIDVLSEENEVTPPDVVPRTRTIGMPTEENKSEADSTSNKKTNPVASSYLEHFEKEFEDAALEEDNLLLEEEETSDEMGNEGTEEIMVTISQDSEVVVAFECSINDIAEEPTVHIRNTHKETNKSKFMESESKDPDDTEGTLDDPSDHSANGDVCGLSPPTNKSTKNTTSTQETSGSWWCCCCFL